MEQDHKRKRPPTNASPNQASKKQRGADGPSTKKNGSGSNDQEALLAEILALGGNEDDLELINGIESDDEHVNESAAPVDKKLRDELAALSKQLGFADMAPQEASEDEDEEEEEDNRENEKIPESRKMGNLVCPLQFVQIISDR
jgi:ribosome biogenesis protein MAK21